ncbi:hypothetical protein F4553_005539 [Allocatelliglobosispora scoriae]|uniref:FtsX-like permease family protein n=1 Tax=Allocatelliglobosispora scoriae TaxID=643052 RepID=A0A841BWQ4_9ACTN|nr:hypothetical protein [Allocatelliglobosispora scoriae]MBB5872105.1 hypothetical protein [Allocatelliglobosispora scoriae]
MIAMVALLIRARWRPFLVICGLAMIIGGLAAAGASYPATIADQLAADAVADAPVVARSVTVAGNDAENVSDLSGQIDSLRKLDGFTTTFAAQFNVMGLVNNSYAPLLYREGFCEHVRITAGRCPTGAGEVAIPTDMGTRIGVYPGAQLELSQAIYDEGRKIYVPGPDGHPVDVVGHYQPIDLDEDYWGSSPYFQINLRGQLSGPMLATPATFKAIPHTSEQWTAEAVIDPAILAEATWPDVRQRLLEGRVVASGDDLPRLLDTIAAKRTYVSIMAPAVLIPVLLLGCVVIFIVSSRRVQHERTELGVQGLRGLPLNQRWWLAIGAPGIAIVLGAIVGGAVGATVAGGLGWLAVLAVTAATLAAITAVALAALPVLRARPADALRRISPSGLAKLPIVEAVLAALAIASLLQLRTGDRSGLGVFAAALIAAAVAAAVARFLPPLARPLTGWAIRRGHLVLGLATAQISRRQGGRQLLALTGLTVALVTLVASAQSVATSVRESEVGLILGADRVLTVQAESWGAVYDAVRKVDPEGRFAVTVGQISADAQNPGILAVDLDRADLLEWPTAATVRETLQAKEAEVPLLGGGDFTVEADLALQPGQDKLIGQPALSMRVAFPNGGSRTVEVGTLRLGTHVYTGVLPSACTDSDQGTCRIVGFLLGVGPGVHAEVSLLGLRSGTTGITGFAAWHQLGAKAPVGPVWELIGGSSSEREWLMPVDAPIVLPVAYTPGLDIEARGQELAGPDGTTPGIDLAEAVEVPVLPRLGDRGILVDYGALGRATGGGTGVDVTEIWLTAAAPSDIVDKINATGVRVAKVERRTDARAQADRTAPALTLRMHTVAALVALILLLATVVFVAGVDRSTSDVNALRLAGVPMRTVRRSMRTGYLVIVGLGALLGLAAAGVAWFAARAALPLFDKDPWAAPPEWPGALSVLVPVAVAAGALAITSWLAFARRETAATMRGATS